MEPLITWQSVLFLSSLAIGVIIVIGAGLGAAGDFEVEVEADGESGGLLAFLDIGQVPFTILLMIATIVFGSVGFIANTALVRTLGEDSPLPGILALALALVVMVFLTGRIARLLLRYLPASESHVARASDLIGAEGVMFTAGFADVQTSTEVHRVACRSASPLAPGMRVRLTDYDPAAKIYEVAPLPE